MTQDENFFVTSQWLGDSVRKLAEEKAGASFEVANEIAVSVVQLLASGSKRFEQYYPGLAEKVRRAYRLTIDAMRDAAQENGYALAVHGSLSRDIDVIAVPWKDDAVSAEEVAEAIRLAAEKANPHHMAFVGGGDPCPREKPHGRLAWSFHLGNGPFIDLSVMPRRGVMSDGVKQAFSDYRR